MEIWVFLCFVFDGYWEECSTLCVNDVTYADSFSTACMCVF